MICVWERYIHHIHVPPAQSALLHAVSASDRFAALTAAFCSLSIGQGFAHGHFQCTTCDRYAPEVANELTASLLALGLPVDWGCTDI